MNNEPNSFWCNWLTAVSVTIAFFSPSLILFPKMTHGFFNWVAFFGDPPIQIADPIVEQYLSFVYGVLGAVMLGWSLVMYFVIRGPFQRGERWAWNSLAVPVTLWFLVDSLHSLVSGYWGNIIFNTSFFAAFCIPLIATYADFRFQANRS